MPIEPKKKRDSKPISLSPLSFDEAVFDMLKVKPELKQGEAKMPKFKVTYRCPTCGHEDLLEANYTSKFAALSSCSSPCPNHEDAGDLKATKALEIKKGIGKTS